MKKSVEPANTVINPIMVPDVIENITLEQAGDVTDKKVRKPRVKALPLAKYYNIENRFEIGIDEAGRGPLFGRVYVAAAILPKDDSFRHEEMKDSKKFTSKKKIAELSEYIKANSIAYSIQYIEHDEIDRINILQATLKAMHMCVRDCMQKMGGRPDDYYLLVDGNQFKPYMQYDDVTGEMSCVRHEMVEGGDNKYTTIAAASILAKVARDTYIADLCLHRPELVTRYGLDTNMGYGTKKHLDGIREFGRVEGHRVTFAAGKP